MYSKRINSFCHSEVSFRIQKEKQNLFNFIRLRIKLRRMNLRLIVLRTTGLPRGCFKPPYGEWRFAVLCVVKSTRGEIALSSFCHSVVSYGIQKDRKMQLYDQTNTSLSPRTTLVRGFPPRFCHPEPIEGRDGESGKSKNTNFIGGSHVVLPQNNGGGG